MRKNAVTAACSLLGFALGAAWPLAPGNPAAVSLCGNICYAAENDYVLSGPDSTNPLGTSAYWLNQYSTTGDNTILDAAAISSLNLGIIGRVDSDGRIYRVDLLSENERLSAYSTAELTAAVQAMIQTTTGSWQDVSQNAGEYYYDGSWVTADTLTALLENRNLDAAAAYTVRLGVVTDRANLRILPTELGMLDDASEIATHYDSLQETVLDPSEGVIILRESADGKYYYVMASDYTGWVLQSQVALVDTTDAAQKAFWEQLAADDKIVQSKKYATVIANKLNGSATGALYQMGASLALNDAGDTLQLPVRNENGTLTIDEVALSSLLNSETDLTTGVLAYTDNNIIRQSFKFLNDTYGWGGQDESVDCSAFVQDVYASMGIELPRDADLQELACPQRLDLTGLSHAERLQLFTELDLPVGSLICTGGHIMLYLGNDADGRPVVINSMSSYYPDGEKEYIRRVAVSYADFPSSNASILDKANSIAFIRSSVANLYTTTEANTGLHMYGSNHSLIQAANISSDSAGYVGLRLSGNGNTLAVDSGTTVSVTGTDAVGLLADGTDLTIKINGTLQSSATAISIANTETGSASVNGIVIGDNGSVSGDINIGSTGTLSGSITGTVNGTIKVAGTLAPATGQSMTLNGNVLLQDGAVIRYTTSDDSSPLINVTGTVTQAEDSTVTLALDEDAVYSLGETENISSSLIYENGTGKQLQLANAAGTTLYTTALLQAVYTGADDDSLVFQLKPDAATELDLTQDEAAVLRMVQNSYTNSGNGAEFAKLLALKSSSSAQNALASLSGNDIAQAAAYPLRSDLPQRALLNHLNDHPGTKIWADLDKRWGLQNDLNFHSQGFVLGYDAFAPDTGNVMAGVLFSYEASALSGASSGCSQLGRLQDEISDYRLGFYFNRQADASSLLLYADAGQVKHKLQRSLPTLGESPDSRCSGRLLEAGARYTWGRTRLKPYLGLRAAHYRQDGYAENGAYGAAVHSYSGNSCSSELGLTYQVSAPQASFQAGLGWLHRWDAGQTAVAFNYRNDAATVFHSTADNDRNRLQLSLAGKVSLGRGWSLNGSFSADRSLAAPDRRYGCSATLQYSW